MKKSLIIFLRIFVILAGVGVATLLLWGPHLEGVNAHATSLSQIYFDDPFLAYVYTGSVAFFVALYQVFKLLGYVGNNDVFSRHSIKALRTIKYASSVLATFIFGAQAWLFVFERGKDDITGGLAVSLILLFISLVIMTTASVFQRQLKSVVNAKTENDLTV